MLFAISCICSQFLKDGSADKGAFSIILQTPFEFLESRLSSILYSTSYLYLTEKFPSSLLNIN
jgi:hypothetical protein